MSSFALWLDSVFSGFDLAVTLFVHNLAEWGGAFFTPFFEGVSILGSGAVFLILLSLCLLAIKKTRRAGLTMLLAIALGALVTNLCLKPLVGRLRPYADAAGQYYELWLSVGQAVESDYSFPSGHTTAACAASMAAFLGFDKRWSWLCFLFAALMAVARLYLVVHYATDVLAGILVGSLAGLAAAAIVKKIPPGRLREA